MKSHRQFREVRCTHDPRVSAFSMGLEPVPAVRPCTDTAEAAFCTFSTQHDDRRRRVGVNKPGLWLLRLKVQAAIVSAASVSLCPQIRACVWRGITMIYGTSPYSPEAGPLGPVRCTAYLVGTRVLRPLGRASARYAARRTRRNWQRSHELL